jgi:site-specific DNA-methyltransferase (adenine-specific)
MTEKRERYGDLIVPEFRLLKGDCLETLKTIPDNSVDSVVCDPPYHLQSIVQRYGKEGSAPAQEGTDGLFKRSSKGFMGKTWDGGDIAFRPDVWKECLRVLKPGGHLIAFGGTRTIHRITCAIEDAGFEIRDQLGWIYYSGFPKSHCVSKGIDRHLGADREVVGNKRSGIGSGSSYGKIVGSPNPDTNIVSVTAPATPQAEQWDGWGTALKPAQEPACLARKPISEKSIAANVLKWGTGGLNIDACRFAYGDPCWVGPADEVSNIAGSIRGGVTGLGKRMSGQVNNRPHPGGRWPANIYACPKPSRTEKEAGLQHLDPIAGHDAVSRAEGSAGLDNPRAGAGRTADEIRNTHPTVKPTNLFRWLCRLVTPPGGTVLDPFLGSGTTAVSAILEGFDAVGCELTEEYHPIIEGRIDEAYKAWRNENRQYRLFQ